MKLLRSLDKPNCFLLKLERFAKLKSKLEDIIFWISSTKFNNSAQVHFNQC